MNHSFRSRRWLAAALMLLCIAILSACNSYEPRGGLLNEPRPAPDFTLIDQNGQPFQLSEQQGNLILMFFGFTTCPDFCPATLAEMAQVRNELGRDAEQVQVLFVTVDPERDTPERIGQYVTRFDPSFIGLTGSQEQLEEVFRSYGVYAERRELPDSALEYTMDHSLFVYVIDRTGMWRAVFPYGMEVEDMMSDTRYFLRQGAS